MTSAVIVATAVANEEEEGLYRLGIDMGTQSIKIVVVKDNEIVARYKTVAGFDQRSTVEAGIRSILRSTNITKDDLATITVTGSGRKDIPFAQYQITEITADAIGVHALIPSARTVVDVGAEEGRGIRCDANGKVIDFAVNEKCAAGAGAFTEAMARALELSVKEFGRLALQSNKSIPMNAQCVVFAESEVVSLIHAKTPKADIARAVHDAIASRIVSMVRRVGIEPEVVVVGGVANNPGFVEALKRDLGMDVKIPEYPEFVGAYGAAIYPRTLIDDK